MLWELVSGVTAAGVLPIDGEDFPSRCCQGGGAAAPWPHVLFLRVEAVNAGAAAGGSFQKHSGRV